MPRMLSNSLILTISKQPKISFLQLSFKIYIMFFIDFLLQETKTSEIGGLIDKLLMISGSMDRANSMLLSHSIKYFVLKIMNTFYHFSLIFFIQIIMFIILT